MLTIDPEKVCYIIVKAREFDEEVAPEGLEGGSNASDDNEVAILEDTPGNPTQQELMAALDALNEDEMVELLALLWLGRGDYTRKEWKEALAQARETRDAHAASYLAGTPNLGDLLEEGLALFGHSCADMEMGRL